MTSIEKNVNSYDSGGKTFVHDPDRGKWRSISDFYLGCIGHAFGVKCFTVLPFFLHHHGGIFFIIPYTIGLLIFGLPVFIFQSFLGQFSSTGFISVFRISPLFKGIGYVILVLNIASICYTSAIAAYPLIYFFASFTPSLPWMTCDHSFNTNNCTTIAASTNDSDSPYYYWRNSWSTLEYYEFGIANFDNDDYEDKVTKIAWPIFFGTILIWIIMAGIFSKGFQMVSLAIRLSTIIALTFFGIFFVRLLCLPGAMMGILNFISPYSSEFYYIHTFVSAPFITVFIFGSGWGTILTMASYNHFKTDVIRYSRFIGFGLMILFGFCVLATAIMEDYLYDYLNFSHYGNDFILEFVIVSVPYLLGKLEAPNMWSMIFFSMLFLAEFCGLLIQMLAILTAIFDEFENLRAEKQRITLLIISCIGLGSLIFTTNKEVRFFNILVSFGALTQSGICFLEIIVVIWFYGRQRFQRDIQFMLGRTFATWKFFVIRFLTPLFISLVIFFSLFASVGSFMFMHPTLFEQILIFITKIFPWICVPVFIVIKLLNTTGTLYHRFKKSIWPNDWYPVDPIYRQQYEKTLGTSDISHQLITMRVDDEECQENVCA